MSNKCKELFSLYFLFFLAVRVCAGNSQTPSIFQLPSPYFFPKDTSAYDIKIIDSFNQHGCAGTRSLSSPSLYPRMSPRALAIIAYCTDDTAESERLFSACEEAAPSDEIIPLLHARKRGTDTGKEPISLGDTLQHYINLQAGLGYDSNPLRKSASTPNYSPSGWTGLVANGGFQRLTSFGSVLVDYAASGSYYPSNHSADSLVHQVDIPISFRAGANEDVKLRPFGTFNILGGANYSMYGGLAVMGLSYRGAQRNTVQGSVFQDHYYSSALRPQQGTHFRFDYVWEFYLLPLYLKLSAYIEHVQAGQSRQSSTKILYSHNDIATENYLEYDFKWVLVGIYANILLREDDDNSTYLVDNIITYRRRQDLGILAGPLITFPIGTDAQLLAYYRYSRRFSNWGPRDYVDENLVDHNIGMALRVFLGNF